jgi:hypothetical protein
MSSVTRAQSWKWAKGVQAGYGFINNLGSFTGAQWYADMTTDPAGNLYLLCNGGSQFQIAGNTVNGFSNEDIIVTSFTCDGAYRWSKVIGSSSDSEKGYAIKADAVGGVYVVAGMWSTQTKMIGGDTSMAADNRTMYIIKLDTAGAYKWVRMPQADTISSIALSRQSQIMDVDVDEQGGVHVLAYLAPGRYGGSYVVSSHSMHVLHYNAGGQFLSGILLSMSLSSPRGLDALNTTRMSYNAGAGRYIVKGAGAPTGPFSSGPLSIGGTSIPLLASYIAAFNAATGALLWLRNGTLQSSISGRPAADLQNNLYITGRADNSTVPGPVVFNGVTLSNGPYVMKLNGATGSAIWTQSGQSNFKMSTVEFPEGNALAVRVVECLLVDDF